MEVNSFPFVMKEFQNIPKKEAEFIKKECI